MTILLWVLIAPVAIVASIFVGLVLLAALKGVATTVIEFLRWMKSLSHLFQD